MDPNPSLTPPARAPSAFCHAIGEPLRLILQLLPDSQNNLRGSRHVDMYKACRNHNIPPTD